MRIWRVVGLIGLIGLMSSCASVPSEIEALDKTQKAYERTLRWSGLEQANVFLKVKDQVSYTPKQRKRLKNIQVTGYRIISSRPSKSKASQLVEIRYFNSEYAIERTLTDRQRWEYDKEEERWYLVSPLPRFK